MSGVNSTPGFYDNQIPSTNQWNGAFATKVDASSGYAANLTVDGADILLTADPTVPMQAATKRYVDSRLGPDAGIPDVPDDGGIYSRTFGNWLPFTISASAAFGGDGTPSYIFRLIPASPAQIAAGSDNAQAISSSGLRAQLGADAATLATTAKTVVPAINEVKGALALALPLAGGTLTGALTLAADPASALQPVTLQYYTAHLPPASASLPLMNGTAAAGTGTTWARADHVHPSDASRLALSGGTLTGALLLAAAPTVPLGAATKGYVDGVIGLGPFLPISGGTLTGALSVGAIIRGTTGRIMAQSAAANPAVSVYDQTQNYAAGMFISASRSLYFGTMDGNGNYAGTPFGYFDASGNLTTAGNVTANGGTMSTGGSSMGQLGMLGQGMGWWMKFNWDGTNVPAYANNNYACTLVSSNWVSTNYFPRTGGQIFSGGNDPFSMLAPQGGYARIMSIVGNTRTWSFGTASSGAWVLSDESANRWGVILADTNGNVNLANALFCNSGWKPGGGMWGDSSDARIKDVAGDFERGLADILKLRPRVFSFRGNDRTSREIPSPHQPGQRFAGLIAQEVEDDWPELVSRVAGIIDDEDVDDLRTLDTTPTLYAVFNALREIDARLRRLEK